METTKAIVLNCIRYGDNSVVVSFFSERFGTISSLVRMPRTRRNDARYSLLQRLSVVEVGLDYRESREMQGIRNISSFHTWKSIPYHPLKVSVAMFLAEFLYNALRSESQNARLFDFLEKSLIWFDETDNGISGFHLILPLKLTLFLGIRPNIEGYRSGMFFDMQSGVCVDVPPLHKYVLTREEAAFLPLLLNTDYGQIHTLALTREQRWHILKIIIVYYRLHVPGFSPLRSADILREVFS